MKYSISVRGDSLGRLRILATDCQLSRREKCPLLPVSNRKGKVQDLFNKFVWDTFLEDDWTVGHESTRWHANWKCRLKPKPDAEPSINNRTPSKRMLTSNSISAVIQTPFVHGLRWGTEMEGALYCIYNYIFQWYFRFCGVCIKMFDNIRGHPIRSS